MKKKKESLIEGRVATNIPNLDAGSDWLLQLYRYTIKRVVYVSLKKLITHKGL